MYILGIETSCDNTAVALINKNKTIYKYNINQNNMLIKYGGYIPHMLAEKHSYIFEKIQKKIIKNINKVNYIAVTTGPGISLSLCIGYRFATFLQSLFKINIFFIDHIEAHIISYRFYKKQKYPYTCLIISGGHTLIVNVKNLGQYYLLSKTIDDSIGEVFDKIAKYLKLVPQNGFGVEKNAKNGNQIEELNNININIKNNKNNLSFSGIKTKFINIIKKQKYTTQDICYTFQQVISKYLNKKLKKIIHINNLYKQNLIICGGVANNQTIFKNIKKYLKQINIKVHKVKKEIACDNAEMVAWLCYEYIQNKINTKKSQMCSKTTVYSKLNYNQIT